MARRSAPALSSFFVESSVLPLPAGFNVLRETDGQLAIGGAIQQDVFHIEGTEKVIRGIDVPAGFWEIHNSEEQAEKIKRNMRAILQLFNIRVYVLPDKVEIQGAIPGQVLDKPTQDQLAGASIISSARGSGGWGYLHLSPGMFNPPFYCFVKISLSHSINLN